jgi:hypothetical protein
VSILTSSTSCSECLRNTSSMLVAFTVDFTTL